MKIIIIVLVMPFILFSCNDIARENEESMEVLYVFEGIEYVTNDIIIDTPYVDLPLLTYSNGTDIEQSYHYNPLEKFPFELSMFVSADEDAFVVENVTVNVPEYIDEYGVVFLGREEWRYTNLVQKQETTRDFSKEFHIAPQRKLNLKARIWYRNYTVPYRLFLQEENTGKRKVIEGIWEGNYLDSCVIEESYSNL